MRPTLPAPGSRQSAVNIHHKKRKDSICQQTEIKKEEVTLRGMKVDFTQYAHKPEIIHFQIVAHYLARFMRQTVPRRPQLCTQTRPRRTIWTANSNDSPIGRLDSTTEDTIYSQYIISRPYFFMVGEEFAASLLGCTETPDNRRAPFSAPSEVHEPHTRTHAPEKKKSYKIEVFFRSKKPFPQAHLLPG